MSDDDKRTIIFKRPKPVDGSYAGEPSKPVAISYAEVRDALIKYGTLPPSYREQRAKDNALYEAEMARKFAWYKQMFDALNKIAAWDEGEEVGPHFDEPHAAKIARKALEPAPDKTTA